MEPKAGVWSLVGNVIWILVVGWELALAHLLAGLLLCVTIIGIPLGIAAWKMVPLALIPLGREVVAIDSVSGDPYGVPAAPTREGHGRAGPTSRHAPS